MPLLADQHARFLFMQRWLRADEPDRAPRLRDARLDVAPGGELRRGAGETDHGPHDHRNGHRPTRCGRSERKRRTNLIQLSFCSGMGALSLRLFLLRLGQRPVAVPRFPRRGRCRGLLELALALLRAALAAFEREIESFVTLPAEIV